MAVVVAAVVVVVAAVINAIPEAWRLGELWSVMVRGCLRNAALKIKRIPLPRHTHAHTHSPLNISVQQTVLKS